MAKQGNSPKSRKLDPRTLRRGQSDTRRDQQAFALHGRFQPTSVSTSPASPDLPDPAAKGVIIGAQTYGTGTLSGGFPFESCTTTGGAAGVSLLPLEGFIRNFLLNLVVAPVAGTVGVPNTPPSLVLNENGVGTTVCIIPVYVTQAAGVYKDLHGFGYQSKFNSITSLAIGSGAAATAPGISAWSCEWVTIDGGCVLGSVVHASSGLRPTASSTTYSGFMAADTTVADVFKSTENLAQFPVPIAGTFSLLSAAFQNAQPSDAGIVYTFRKNGADTTLLLSLPASAANGYRTIDATHSVAVVAGDLVNLKVVNSSTSAGMAYATFSVEFIPTTSGSCIIPWSLVDATGLAAPATLYVCPFGGAGGTGSKNPNTTESNVRFPIPCAGTIKNLYAMVQTAPSGGTCVLTLYKNGASTGLTITIGSGTSGVVSDIAHSVSVVQGDTISLEVVSNGGTPVITTAAAEFAHA